ncbi:MAG: hypothetical protein ACJ751_22480 [Niastella sp.]|uniref:hypothetical protein n=1 Tax=Niastella sp. TaxID=1869183 RepID=UPI00389ADD99
MDIENLNRIAFQYSRKEDFHLIEFQWNGKFGKELEDANGEFRIQLCEFIFPQIEKVNIELIRDLYMEFAKASEAALGAYMKLNLLGQELLIRAYPKYLMDYLEGASYNSDVYAASAKINISKELAKQILSFIEEKLKETANEKEKKLLEQIGKIRFGWLAGDRL